MIKKINLVLILLSAFILINCKSANKTRKPKVIEKTENEKRAEAFFYHNYSKKLGYQLKGNEDLGFLEMVESWLGVPYKYGGCDKSGTDCSCFVAEFYKEYFKINLPRKSDDMQKQSKEIDVIDLQTGDLVFFKIKSEKTSHVGIYISNQHFVHATTSKGVMINSLDENYYKTYFFKAGRIKQ